MQIGRGSPARAAADPPHQRNDTVFTNILQPSHVLIILIVALVLLGPKRLPAAGRALGQGLKELRSSIGDGHEDDRPIAAAPAVIQEDKSGAAQ
jgi:sec-independent protein translocase protein TatA